MTKPTIDRAYACYARFAEMMLDGTATVVSGDKVMDHIKVVNLKNGGVHISYNAKVKKSSARVLLLKKGVRISNLVGTAMDINKTVGTVLSMYRLVKEYMR